MPIFGVAIVKRVTFRLVGQEFANVYHYDIAVAGLADLTDLANDIVVIEKAMHATDVVFLRYAVWEAGGTPGQNKMLIQGPLSGTGSQLNSSSMDRERAFLIRWPAGTDIRGKPVYLRKWYHSCGSVVGVAPTANNLQNTDVISTANRASIATHAQQLANMTAGTNAAALCAKSGRDPTGPAECHAWLEHHQLGDMWR